MVELTKLLNKKRFVLVIVNSSLNFFFLVIRKIWKQFSQENGNIVIISLHKLGDMVFTIPAIREIQKFFGKRVIVVCYPEGVPIYKLGLSDIDFCEVEHKHFYLNMRIAKRIAKKKIRSLNPEIIFDLTGVMTSASLIFNSRAKKIIGTNHLQFKTIYDLYIPIRQKPHLIDKYLDIVSLYIPGINHLQIKEFRKAITTINKILIHPYAGWKAKEWGLRKYIKLAENLEKDYKVNFVIPCNTLTKGIIYEIEAKGMKIIETQNTEEMISCIRQCSVFIGNDSGPVHIASLLGKPTFGIYGPTNPYYHIPFGKYNSYVGEKIKCSPTNDEKLCFTEGGRVGCPSFECMKKLSVEKVVKDVREFLVNIENEALVSYDKN